MKGFLFTLGLLYYAVIVSAQIKMPAPSPTFTLKGAVGLAEVEVEYSRPSAKGREVAGNLIPYNEVWRTGANASTKISFSENVTLNGYPVPAGKYALYTIFTEDVATIILSKNLTWWGSLGYNDHEDLLRFDVPVKHPSSHYETFTISFSDFTMNSANLNMKWEHTKAMFKIESEVDESVMADIKAQVIDANPSNPDVYFQAAVYYYDTERDSELAFQWVNKLIEVSENDKYWVFHLKAKILARLGRHSEAIQSAEKSIELAEAGGNPDYVRLNQQLISSIKK